MVGFVGFFMIRPISPNLKKGKKNEILFGSRCRSESAGTIYERQTTKPEVQIQMKSWENETAQSK